MKEPKEEPKKELEIGKSASNQVVIKLVSEIAQRVMVDDEGKKKEVVPDKKDGEVGFVRNDNNSLQRMLANRFDSKQYRTREIKNWLMVKDKLYRAYLQDSRDISMTLDEAGFLKGFLQGLIETSKESKDQAPLNEFEARTLFAVLEQLE